MRRKLFLLFLVACAIAAVVATAVAVAAPAPNAKRAAFTGRLICLDSLRVVPSCGAPVPPTSFSLQ